MSQAAFGNLSSPTSGTTLIDTKIEPAFDALLSMHSGTSRPSYAVAGIEWLDTTTTPWVLKFFDGTNDISLGTINASTHVFTPANAGMLASTYDPANIAQQLVGTTAVQTLTNKTINQANLVGTTTNDSAAAGSVGEYVEAIVLTGAATSLTTATAKTVTSISLTAGDWDVSGFIGFNTGGTTTTTVIAGGISTTNNTLPSPNDTSCFQLQCSFVTNAFNQQQCGMKRISIASTTTVYLVATSTFATSTCAAWGTIRARRVR